MGATELYKNKEISLGAGISGYDEFNQRAKTLLNDLKNNQRNVMEEIVGIGRKNLPEVEDIFAFILDKWNEDNKQLERGIISRSVLENKLNGIALTKEDTIRLCFYLKISFENRAYENDPVNHYDERFNNVFSFMNNLFPYARKEGKDYGYGREGLSARVFADNIWMHELKKSAAQVADQRKEYVQIRSILDNIEKKLIQYIDSLTFSEILEFMFEKEGAGWVFSCVEDGAYYNNIMKADKAQQTFIYKNYSNKTFDAEEKVLIEERLSKICPCPSQSEGSDIDKYYAWYRKAFIEYLTNMREHSAKLQTETDIADAISDNAIETFMYLFNDEKSVLDTAFVAKMNELAAICIYAKHSVSMKKLIGDRLNVLKNNNRKEHRKEANNSETGLIYERFYDANINGVYLSKSIDIEMPLITNIDYHEIKNPLRKISPGNRQAFILVTLLWIYRNTKEQQQPEYYFDYLNTELAMRHYSRLDSLNYFDAVMILIIGTGQIDKYLIADRSASCKEFYAETQWDGKKADENTIKEMQAEIKGKIKAENDTTKKKRELEATKNTWEECQKYEKYLEGWAKEVIFSTKMNYNAGMLVSDVLNDYIKVCARIDPSRSKGAQRKYVEVSMKGYMINTLKEYFNKKVHITDDLYLEKLEKQQGKSLKSPEEELVADMDKLKEKRKYEALKKTASNLPKYERYLYELKFEKELDSAKIAHLLGVSRRKVNNDVLELYRKIRASYKENAKKSK